MGYTVVMNKITPIMHICLNCASSRALLIAVATSRRVSRTAGVWGFLAWLRLFLIWLCGEGQETTKVQIRTPRIINRQDRRSFGNNPERVSEISMLYHLFGRGISLGRFWEKMCRLSLYGRVKILGIKFWGTVLVRRALLVCYDHGWWRTPLGEFGRVRHGFWQVHLWPE